VSNEQQYQRDMYFDDVTMSYTPSAIIQGNEYYPFGLQTANSWTRDGSSNNYLANGSTEFNPTSSVYDLDFRNYDPVLGRLNQVDPLATNDVSLSPYHYSFNNPVRFIDPSGAWGDNGEVADPTPTYLHDPSEYGSGVYKRANDPGGYGSGMTIAFTTIYSVTRGVKDENGNWIPEYTTQSIEAETEYITIEPFVEEQGNLVRPDPIDIFDENKTNVIKGLLAHLYYIGHNPDKQHNLRDIVKSFKDNTPWYIAMLPGMGASNTQTGRGKISGADIYWFVGVAGNPNTDDWKESPANMNLEMNARGFNGTNFLTNNAAPVYQITVWGGSGADSLIYINFLDRNVWNKIFNYLTGN
jgi:RHS repeat-associated protein